MSGSDGFPALALSLPSPPETASPAWGSDVVDGLVHRGLVTAAAALVADAGEAVAYARSGDARRSGGGGEPLFDLASLTKPWTASLALRLDAGGTLPLGLEIGEVWPRCERRLAGRTLEDLLRHRAGFQPWTPLYERCRASEDVADLLLGGELLGAPAATYSDLDLILWGLSASEALDRSLADLLAGELIEPLGLEARSAPTGTAFWVPCALGNEREVELAAAQGFRVAAAGPPAPGRVQDGNARFLGALAGHAGLFATPWAMLALAREWLAPGALWPAEAVERAMAGDGLFALGWRRVRPGDSGGPALGPGAFGHVSFTGGSVFVDPGRGRVLILLAHRSRAGAELLPERHEFHRLAIDACG